MILNTNISKGKNMLSNVDVVNELGKNIVVLPLRENTIGSAYINLTASSIAWSRSSSKMLRIASIKPDGMLKITRVDDLENDEKQIKNLKNKIKQLKKAKGKDNNATDIVAENASSNIDIDDGERDKVSNSNHHKIIERYDEVIAAKVKELSEKEDSLKEKKLAVQREIDALEKELQEQLLNEINGKKEASFLVIPPHDTGLILTNETVAITEKYGGLFHAIVKDVSYGRGHIATTLNPGWYGKPLVAVHNHTDKSLMVQLNSRFVKLSFHELKSKATLRPNDLGSRSDIVDHLKLYRSNEYNEISNFFIGNGVDLKYLLKTFNAIRKGKIELNDTEKKILLNDISSDIVKKNYDKSKEKSYHYAELLVKYHSEDILVILMIIVSGFAFFHLINSNNNNKEYLIPICSALIAFGFGRLYTKYIENK